MAIGEFEVSIGPFGADGFVSRDRRTLFFLPLAVPPVERDYFRRKAIPGPEFQVKAFDVVSVLVRWGTALANIDNSNEIINIFDNDIWERISNGIAINNTSRKQSLCEKQRPDCYRKNQRVTYPGGNP